MDDVLLSRMLYNVAGYPTDLCQILVFSTLAKPSSRKGFFALIALAALISRLQNVLRLDLPIMGPQLMMLYAFLRFGTGTIAGRIVAMVMGISYTSAVQLPTAIAFAALCHVGPQQIADNALGYPLYFVTQVVVAMTTILSDRLLRSIIKAVGERDLTKADVPSMLLLSIQVFWFLPLYYSDWYTSSANPIEMALLLVSHIVAFASALLYCDYMGAAKELRESEMKAKTLSSAVSGYERHYREMEDYIERVAMLRHEARNHVQVVGLLVEQGDAEGAKAMLDSALLAFPPFPDEADSAHDKAAPTSSQTETRTLRTPWKLLAIAYALNVVLSLYMDVSIMPKTRMGLGMQLLLGVTPLAWVVLTPYLVRMIHRAGEADIARAKVWAAQEMLDARVHYGARIAEELEQARTLEESLQAQALAARRAIDEDMEWQAAILSLPSTQSGLAMEQFCENRSLDALLALKASACTELGIEFLHAVDVPREAWLSDLELCTLFSNMLDNAIEACKEAVGMPPVIEVAATLDPREFVAVVRNSCGPEGAAAAINRTGTKSLSDMHGWGLRILSALVRRHNGAVHFAEEDGVFTTTLLIRTETQAPRRQGSETARLAG